MRTISAQKCIDMLERAKLKKDIPEIRYVIEALRIEVEKNRSSTRLRWIETPMKKRKQRSKNKGE